MITEIFEPIMVKIMDAYIIDMVVESKKKSDNLNNLANVFTILKEYKLRLNAIQVQEPIIVCMIQKFLVFR